MCPFSHSLIIKELTSNETLIYIQSGQKQVPDPHPSATQDRPNGHDDAGGREARRHVQRRGRLQGTDWEAQGSRRDSFVARKLSCESDKGDFSNSI